MTTPRRFTLVHGCVVATFLGTANAQVDPDPGRSATCAQPDQFGVEVFTNEVVHPTAPHRADAELAVGPCHVIAIANVGIKAYHKPGPAGTLDSRLSEENFTHGLDAFWAPVLVQQNPPVGYSRAGDPQAVYDALSGRFWASALFFERVNLPPSPTPEAWYLALAVSKGSDPNVPEPAWWFYYADMTTIVPSVVSIDRPTVSIDADRVYLAAYDGFSGSAARVVVLDKAPLLNGSAPTVFVPDETTQVVDLMSSRTFLAVRYGPDDGTAQYLVNDELLGGASASSIRLWAITRQTPPTSVTTTVAVPTYYTGSCAPQLGSAQTLLTDIGETLSAVYRHGSVWVVQTTRAGPGSSEPNVAMVRWYEFTMNGWPDSGQPTLRQTGLLDVPWPLYAYYPSIAVDSFGNAAITFNVSGENKYASMWQAFRCHSDALNTFRIPFEIEAGQQAYEGGDSCPDIPNWGDYSGTEPDPVAGALFWSHAQLPADPPGPTSRWRSWLTRTEAPCSLDTDGDNAVSIADLGGFMQLYGEGSPKADYHSDGVIDVQDVTAFTIDLGGP